MSTIHTSYRPCPACGDRLPDGVRQCRCGHVFGGNQGNELFTEEQALEEEELFAAYIDARIDQAIAALETARAQFVTDPKDVTKAARVFDAIHEAQALRAQRDAQRVRTAHAQEAAREARARLGLPAADSAGGEPGAAPSAQATEAFRAQQAVKAEKAMQTFIGTATKTCLHCQTILPVSSALCLCGHRFAHDGLRTHRDQPLDGAEPVPGKRAC